jgi:geranylgeranyl diphosphate synthase, type II
MMDAQATRDHWRAKVEEAIATAVPDGHPAELYEPARYVLQAGGKRLRPILTVLSAEMFGGRGAEVLPAAVAVEVFHNFTLVHDDIMDHADTRRGRPTIHARWDESTAILVGDLLMGLAYGHLSRLSPAVVPEALGRFSVMVRRLCEGQSLDMTFETRKAVSIDEYLAMIDGKTGALLACALELGAIIAGAGPSRREEAGRVGLDIGRAFQIQDDLLDLTASDTRWGKTVGGDLLEGKRTYLLLLARERAPEAELLDRVFEGHLRPDEIAGVRNLMDELGVLDDTRNAVIFHTNAAIERLEAVPASAARRSLVDLVRAMQKRLH